jgi:DNA-binding MarR family transcriptional regulator
MDAKIQRIQALLAEIAGILRSNRKMHAFETTVKDLTLSHMEVLAYLMDHKKAKMSELAAFAKVKMPAMSETVDKLVKNGCVRREHSKEDRRAVLVYITKKSETMVKRHMEQKKKFLLSIMSDLTQDEKEKLIKILTKAKETITKEWL